VASRAQPWSPAWGRTPFDDALAEPHAREMDLTGRAMRGIVFVDPPGTATDDDPGAWLNRCLVFATSLPPR
jgi:hypothetical protein